MSGYEVVLALYDREAGPRPEKVHLFFEHVVSIKCLKFNKYLRGTYISCYPGALSSTLHFLVTLLMFFCLLTPS